MKKKKIWIPLCLIVILALVAGVIAAVLLRRGKEKQKPADADSYETAVLQNFVTDECYFVEGAEGEVTFTVESDQACSSIILCDADGNEIGTMHDDGTDGDELANDLTYSYVMQTDAGDAATIGYYAKAGDQASNETSIYYFAQLTEETAEEAKENYTDVSEKLSALEDSYAGPNGYVSEDSYDELMADVEEILQEQVTAGIVLLYEIEDGAAYIKFSSGLAMVYQPEAPDTSLGDSDVVLTCYTYQPCSDIQESGVTDLMTSLADCLGVSSTSYTESEVTLERIKSLGSNQVIFWNGHGGYGSNVKSFLATGEYFDWDAWFWDTWGYFADCVSDRIIGRSTDAQEGLACVTSKFISYYCGDLSNDIILLAACDSGKDSGLAQSFLDKGATVVLGFTETVYTVYAEYICGSVLANMANEDVTLQEALNMAEDEYGASDLEYARENTDWEDLKSSEAEPIIFGGTAAEQYKFPFGRIEGTVTEAEEGEAISGAQVTVYRDNEEYDTAVTEEDGSYSLRLPIGRYDIDFSAYGCEEKTETGIAVRESETTTQDASLTSATAVLSGVAYDPEDESIRLSGVTITAVYTDEMNGTEYTYTATTEDEGEYSMELPPASYELTITSPSEKYVPSVETEVVTVLAEQENTYDIPVSIAAYLCGYVYDEDGNPLEGVAVTALSKEQIDVVQALTDENGYYELVCYDISFDATFSLDGYDSAEYTLEIDSDARLDSTEENRSRIDDVVLFRSEDEETPADTLEWNGHQYYFYTLSYTWDEAEAFCESMGGHLVTITSADEQGAVYDYVSALAGDEDIFLGLSDAENEGDWSAWVTGESVGYTNWGENEPDDLGGQNYCVLCTGYRGYEGGSYYITPGQWDDNFTSGSTAHFICEWDE